MNHFIIALFSSGPCKRMLNYKWFHIKEGLLYLWIQCDLTKTAEEFLNTLWHLRSLQVLRLDELRGFTEGFFFQILAVLPALEVNNEMLTRYTSVCLAGSRAATWLLSREGILAVPSKIRIPCQHEGGCIQVLQKSIFITKSPSSEKVTKERIKSGFSGG